MKYLILFLSLAGACKVSDKHPGFDPEDIYKWTIKTSHFYYSYDIAYDTAVNGRTESIDIFVKNGNELKWFSNKGVRTFYVQLDSYSKGWYNYMAVEDTAHTARHFFVDFKEKSVTITPDYSTGIIYKQ